MLEHCLTLVIPPQHPTIDQPVVLTSTRKWHYKGRELTHTCFPLTSTHVAWYIPHPHGTQKKIRIHNYKKIFEIYHILCIIVITMIVSLQRREFRSSSIIGKLSMGYVLCCLVQSMSLFSSLPTFQH